MTMSPGREGNIVIFPFMAQGHIIPFLALANQIQQRRENYTITFVNTPLNIRKLRSSLSPNPAIKLHELPFQSSDHGLPPHSENTESLPYPLIIRLAEASISLKPSFRKLISSLIDENEKPLAIIADFLMGWTVDVAREFRAFCAIFSGASGFGLAGYYSLWTNLPHRKTESERVFLPDFAEAGEVHLTQIPSNIASADGTDSWSIFQGKNLPKWAESDGFLFNTVEEIDSIGLGYFRRKFEKPVWAIGPVVLQERVSPKTADRCRKWLDTKPLSSVLYICFGSQNTLSKSQMMSLAMALEVSRVNFIWVIRPPLGFDINGEFRADEWLPEGFVPRLESLKNGLLVENWAPQVEILSHRAVSGFLSHCGWNSTLEALAHGVPILGWAMAAEQFFNVKILEEKLGVCVEVARGAGCEINCEEMVKKIQLVVRSEKGEEMRRRACEVRDLIMEAVKDEDGFEGSSVKAMDEFFAAVEVRE